MNMFFRSKFVILLEILTIIYLSILNFQHCLGSKVHEPFSIGYNI